MIARTAQVRMMYNGKNVTKDISGNVKEFSFTDNAGGKLDDMTLTLEDSKGLFISPWFPGKGATVKVYIDTFNWFEQEEKLSLFCGVFQIDEVEYTVNPDSISLKGVSVPLKTGIKMSKKTRAWDSMKLKDIAQQIASENGLKFFWHSSMNMGADRYDQRDESDLAFLKRALDMYAHHVKLSEKKLIIYFEKDFKETVPSISIDRSKMDNASFKTKTHDTYSKCVVSYADPKTATTNTYTVNDSGVASGQTLKINARATSQADAENQARAALEKKNKFEITSNVSCMGNPHIRAGYKLKLSGVGVFSGSYFIDKAVHTISDGGYKTSMEAHRI